MVKHERREKGSGRKSPGFVNNHAAGTAPTYSEVWNSMFSSTDICAGVPEELSPERVATTRKPLELVWTS